MDVNNENIIEVDGLCKNYGPLRAVDGVTFTVQSGEVFGILGPNGAGKTTTVEMLEGMRLPDAGIARINGMDTRDNPRAVKAMIGIQLQSSTFFERLSLSEILDVFASLYHRRVDALALLRLVELDDRAKSSFKELSGGQKQRFSIATTLVNDPLVLFLDEPYHRSRSSGPPPSVGIGQRVQIRRADGPSDYPLHGGSGGVVR